MAGFLDVIGVAFGGDADIAALKRIEQLFSERANPNKGHQTNARPHGCRASGGPSKENRREEGCERGRKSSALAGFSSIMYLYGKYYHKPV